MLQAHENAQQHSDEFVVEGLVSYDKMSLLVQELLVFEVCGMTARHKPSKRLFMSAACRIKVCEPAGLEGQSISVSEVSLCLPP